MTKVYKQLVVLLTLATLLVIGVNSTLTSANAIYTLNCDTGVHPYNPDGDVITGPDGNEEINFLSHAECNRLVQYNRPFAENPPTVQSAPTKEGTDNISVPIAIHSHAYYNDSTAAQASNQFSFNDVFGSLFNIREKAYYRAVVRAFEIKLDIDATSNTDYDALTCVTSPGASFNAADITVDHCSGDIPGLFGGTHVSKQRIQEGGQAKVLVRWDFGTDNPSLPNLPAVWGNNGNAFSFTKRNQDGTTQKVTLDLTNPENRSAEFSVNLTTKNNRPESWSATTHSRVLIADQAIVQTHFDPDTVAQGGCVDGDILDANSGWCYLVPKAGYETQDIPFTNPQTGETRNHRFFWFNLGSVATVWRKPATPPPPPETRLNVEKEVILLNGQRVRNGVADQFTLYANLQESGAGNARRRAGAQPATEEKNTREAQIARARQGVSPRAGVGNIIDAMSGGVAENALALGTQVVYPNGGGTAQVVQPGTYVISEDTALQNFVPVSIVCDGQPTDRITLAAGDSKNCLVTNMETEDNNPSCPPGQIFGRDRQCHEIHFPPLCPAGQERDENGDCEVPQPPVCPYGTDSNGNCLPQPPLCPYGVDVNGNCLPQPPICVGAGCFPVPPPQAQGGDFHKTATTNNGTSRVVTENGYVNYELTYNAIRYQSNVRIWDETFTNGGMTLRGTEGSFLHVIDLREGAPDDHFFRVFKNNVQIPRCISAPVQSGCYLGTPFNSAGVQVADLAPGSIAKVQFVAYLDQSRLSPTACDRLRNSPNPEFCGEEFPNIGHAVDGESVTFTKKAAVFTPCPFLLTRGIGDVILERDFNYGFDTLGTACGGVPNIEGEIIFPEIPTPGAPLPGSGKAADAPVAPHGVCDKSNGDGGGVDAFKNPFGTLSSGVCELKLNVTEALTRSAMEKGIQDNVTVFTRGDANLGSSYTLTGDNINTVGGVTLSNPNYKVYKVKGGNLTVDGALPVGKGSRTFIVENGDLIIKSDIKFVDDSVLSQVSFKDTPSIAFIVINGSIKVAPGVKELDGVFVALKGANGGGVIDGTADSTNPVPLSVNGVVIGDIEPLFKRRTYVGDAKRNQGTIVINYGAWLYYNLPPVLRDIVDLQQVQTAR